MGDDFLNYIDDFGNDSTMTILDNRFGSTSSAILEEHVHSSIPKNTVMKEKWAVKPFRDWHKVWKVRVEDNVLKVYDDIDYMNE